MNKLNRDCFIGHDTRIYCTILVNIQIFPLVAGNSSFRLVPPQERILVYTLVKLSIKLTYDMMLSTE